MNITIHRGTKEIGGSCVEIWTESTRIVVDLGMPLVNPDGTRFDDRSISKSSTQQLIDQGILPNILGLYDNSGVTSILLSHAHQDHYGLINFVNVKNKIYLGKATHKLVEITNIIMNRDWSISNPQYFQSGTSFTIGDIEITPFLMDHSAYDAYAFLIKADGKSLVYSGDFRIHGRKQGVFEYFKRNVDKNIDYLLLEGTTIGRVDDSFPTEANIENEFIDTFKKNKGINLIYTSGQNIDRLVSIYRACIKTGKTLAIDFYIATVLKEMSKFRKTIPNPSKNLSNLKVFYPYRLSRMMSKLGKEKLMYQFRHAKIKKEQIDEQYNNIVMIVRPSMIDYLNRIKNLIDGVFIYSMWGGYKKEKQTKDFIEYLISKGMSERHIHTSGHADKKALQRMIDATNPKYIIPIHTFNANDYQKHFKNPVKVLKDGETFFC